MPVQSSKSPTGPSKPKLSQRKATAGSAKLSRSRLERLSQEEEQSGSSGKVIFWIIAVILLGVAAFLGLQMLLVDDSGPDDENDLVVPTVGPTTTPNPVSLLVSADVLEDDMTVDVEDDEKWSKEDQEIVSADDLAEFRIDELSVQPYESYLRVKFNVNGGDPAVFPQVTASYDENLASILLTFNNVYEDDSGLPYGQTVSITGSVVESISHPAFAGRIERYELNLAEATKYSLYTEEQLEQKYVVIDVLEKEKRVVADDSVEDAGDGQDTDVTVTPTDEPGTTIVPTPTALPAGSENLTNDFSTGTQRIATATTSRSATIESYNYFDGGQVFTYNLNLSGEYPNVEAVYEDLQLTMTVENLVIDKLVGNGGSGSTDFAAQGVKDISGVEITNDGNGTSTYVFTFNEEHEYRILIDEDAEILRLEVRHS